MSEEVAALRRQVEAQGATLDSTQTTIGNVLDSQDALHYRLAALEAKLQDDEAEAAREDAVFAAGWRAGFLAGTSDDDCDGFAPTPAEVDAAHARWVAGGRKTHLDEGG